MLRGGKGRKIDGRFHVGVLTSRYGQFEKKVFLLETKITKNMIRDILVDFNSFSLAFFILSFRTNFII